MLGLDFSEILIIGVVALVVVGPKELPQMMRTLGRWIAQARRMAGEFQGQMNEALREADLEDVKKHVDDLRSLSPKAILASQVESFTRDLDEVKRETETTVGAIGASLTQGPETAGSAMSAFTVDEAAPGPTADVAPGLTAGEAEARIDQAAAPIDLLAPSVIETTPMPVEFAAAVSVDEPAKKEPSA